MAQITYKDIIKNSRLTDFSDFRNSVINYKKAVSQLSRINASKRPESDSILKDFLR